MKASELKSLDLKELNNKLIQLKKSLFNFRFQHSGGQLDNTAKLKETKIDIARVKTMINKIIKK